MKPVADHELERIETVLAAWRASLTPGQIAEQERALQIYEQRNRERLEYMQDALQRLAVKGDLMNPRSCMPVFVEAWRKLGLPKELFQRSTPAELFQLIEDRINFLDRLDRRAEPSPGWDTFYKSIAGRQGGHPKEERFQINVQVINRHRHSEKLSMVAHARSLRVPRECYRKTVKGAADGIAEVTEAVLNAFTKTGKIPRDELLKTPTT